MPTPNDPAAPQSAKPERWTRLRCRVGLHQWAHWTVSWVAPVGTPYRPFNGVVYQAYRECSKCGRIEEFEPRDGWQEVYRYGGTADWSAFRDATFQAAIRREFPSAAKGEPND